MGLLELFFAKKHLFAVSGNNADKSSENDQNSKVCGPENKIKS